MCAGSPAKFDVLHFHLDYFPFSVFSRQSTPFITTMHGRLDLPEHQTVFNAFGSVPVVSISDAQRKPVPQARWMKTIYHGLPADLLAPRPCKAWTISPSSVALHRRSRSTGRSASLCAAGLPLKIAAKVDRVDRDYFERDIRPLLDLPGIEYIGEIDDAQKSEFLGGALALLMPIDWPEPFGLVMIEAMACGTPVIAFRSGSVPEVVEHGVTGLIVDRRSRRGGRHQERARAVVASAHPRPLRGALHGAPHGRGLSRDLSRPDRRQPSPTPENGQRCQVCRSTYR